MISTLQLQQNLRADRHLNPLNHPDWDSKLAAFAEASFFHSAAWARILHQTYGYRPAYFAQTNGGQLRTVLPVMEISSWLTGRRGVSLPFADECAPLSADADSFYALFQHAIEYGRTRGWKQLQLRGGGNFFADAPASAVYYRHWLDLSVSEQEMFGRCHSAVRRAVRKAQRGGIRLEFSRDAQAMETFYQLHCLTRKRHGTPPQPFVFFKQIQEEVLEKNNGVIVLASYRGRPAAGAVFFRFGKKAIYKFGASDKRLQSTRAGNLVMWESIRWHADRGCEELNFGRTDFGNDGLRRFKLGWGTQESLIRYFSYDLRSAHFTAGREVSASWSASLFRALPLSFSRLIGRALYKHVA